METKKAFVFDVQVAKIDKSLINFIIKTKKEFDGFFKINLKPPYLFYVWSREDFNRIAGFETDEWHVAISEIGKVFIFHPDAYLNMSANARLGEWFRALKHDIAHLYHYEVAGVAKKLYPDWLREGLACYLAGQPQDELDNLQNLNIFNKEYSPYAPGHFWVELLLNTFSQDKLLTLIKKTGEVTLTKDFNKFFLEIYGFEYSRESFAKLLK